MSSIPPYPDLTYLELCFAASHVRRFHMVRIQREQSLTDHSARVAYVFNYLYRHWAQHSDAIVRAAQHNSPLMGNMSAEDYARHYHMALQLAGLQLALHHDLAETLTGDVPSHSKIPVVKAAMNALEDTVLGMVVDGPTYMPEMYSDYAAIPGQPWWPVARALVKLADTAEGLCFSHYAQGLGPHVPDAKRDWVNDNWERMARRLIDNLDPAYFSAAYCEWAVALIIVDRLGVSAQHGG